MKFTKDSFLYKYSLIGRKRWAREWGREPSKEGLGFYSAVVMRPIFLSQRVVQDMSVPSEKVHLKASRNAFLDGNGK